jgi:hypothetical protein
LKVKYSKHCNEPQAEAGKYLLYLLLELTKTGVFMRRLFVSEKENKRFFVEALERFQKKDNRVHNSAVRKNTKESLFAALHKNYKNYKKTKVEGVGIETIFKKLLSN